MPAWMDDDLEERRRRGLYRRRRLHARTVLSFASNDYLNLATDPRLARAAARAARRYGCGAGASPLVGGHLPPHRALERALAEWRAPRPRWSSAAGSRPILPWSAPSQTART